MYAESKTIFHYFINANSIFCIQYLLASIPFLFFERFSVQKPLFCVIILDMFICIILLHKNKGIQLKKINLIKKNELIAFILVLITLPFIAKTSEDIGAVSDQGAYFFHTMVLMEGKEAMIHTLDEMGVISEDVDNGLQELQEELTIYYHDENESYYYPHALRTWCVLPALFGRMLGRWNTLISINYLFLLTILNLFFICNEIRINKYAPYLSIGLFALSPLILYIGKAGLTEMSMLFLFIVGLYYMLENSWSCNLFSAISIGLVGFVHASIYVYLPIISLILFFKSLDENKYKYINAIQLGMYACSIWYDYKISPIYMKKQYNRFTFNGRLDYLKLFLIISSVVFVLILVQLIIDKWGKNFFNKIKNFLIKNFRVIAMIAITIILIRTVYYIYYICFTDVFAIPEGTDAGTWNLRSRYINKGWISASYLNIVNIARATGGIGFVSFLMIPFVKQELSKRSKVLYLCALYSLFIFTVLQLDTPSNYYSSRYFIPFLIPLITIVLASCINSKKWIVCIFVTAIVFNCRYWPSFLEGAPQSGQYTMLQEVLAWIPKETIVFCNPESSFVNTRLTSNLRILNNNQIYNLNNFVEVDNYYPEEDKYIISGESLHIDGAELILQNVYPSQFSFGNGENGSYATNVATYDNPLFVYKITK